MTHFDWDESQSYDYQLSNEFFTNEFNLKIHHVIFQLGSIPILCLLMYSPNYPFPIIHFQKPYFTSNFKCYKSIGMNSNPMFIDVII